VSVNIAARQLQQTTFVGEVADVLAESGLDPRRLVLEITESALVSDTANVVRRLTDLRTLGVRVAVDDFGTGYSSLSYLEDFPVDMLKIPKPFVDSIVEKNEESLAGAIVRLGGTLALQTVAEGIETEEQLAQLTELGCEMGQGFHFARPLTSDRLHEFLRNGLAPAHTARRAASDESGRGSR
jgi:EAL domain-containing protein (putative c-di-GMP-specific phosphodiesterase class I)